MITLVSVAVVAVVALVVTRGGSEPGPGPARAAVTGAPPTSPAAPATGFPLTKPSKSAEDPWLGNPFAVALNRALGAQGAALLNGDQDEYLRPVASSAEDAKAWWRNRFTSLRALGIARWEASVRSIGDTNFRSREQFLAVVTVKYCFSTECSRPATARLRTVWDTTDIDDPRITDVRPNAGSLPPPWALDVLTARAGSRVIVASTAANASRIPQYLSTAENAAVVADGFSTADRPSRYVIYLADKLDYRKWQSGAGGFVSRAAAYALPDNDAVVVNLPAMVSSDTPHVMQHEMTHVSSLAGIDKEKETPDTWWLTEGLAEYAASGSAKFRGPGDRQTRVSFIRSSWNGNLRIREPAAKAPLRDVSGRYGTAHLAVRCLATTYGKEKTVDLFRSVVVQGAAITSASKASLGAPWSTVNRTCAAYVRRAAR